MCATPQTEPVSTHAPLSAPWLSTNAPSLPRAQPEVAKEFSACQQLDSEEVEDELAASGIPVPPTMNDMDMRMMLVEMRMRKSGKISDQKPAPKKPYYCTTVI